MVHVLDVNSTEYIETIHSTIHSKIKREKNAYQRSIQQFIWHDINPSAITAIQFDLCLCQFQLSCLGKKQKIIKYSTFHAFDVYYTNGSTHAYCKSNEKRKKFLQKQKKNVKIKCKYKYIECICP